MFVSQFGKGSKGEKGENQVERLSSRLGVAKGKGGQPTNQKRKNGEGIKPTRA